MNTPDSSQTNYLLEEVEAGNREVFDDLFARHRDELRRSIALRLDGKLRSRLDASDVVQETQLEAYRRLDDYLARRPMPFNLWLRKTAYERLIKLREQHIQAAKRSVEQEQQLPGRTTIQLAEQFRAGGPSPSQLAGDRELIRSVRETLAELPTTDREILVMRYLEKLSNKEIGLLLELDPNTVSKRHVRALLKLEKKLNDKGIRRSNA